MYELNLLLVVFFYPIVSICFVCELNKKIATSLVLSCLILGIVYTYLSTSLGYSFELNILDTIAINIFLFSIYGFITWLFTHIVKAGKWFYYVCIFLSSIFVFIIYNSAFGPSESCGQNEPEQTFFFDKRYKITHCGYQYGLMDYGSRFVIYKHSSGIEKVIGLAENANQYYGKDLNLQLDLKENKLTIRFHDYEKKAKIDTLYIQAR